MQNFKHTSKRLLSMLMAALLLSSSAGTALAHPEDSDDNGTHDETPYSISIYQGKTPNQNGTLTYTITSHEDGTVSDCYDISADCEIVAYEGDTITLYPTANDGYALSSIGYAKADRVEQAFNIKSTTAQDDGSYTFTMPASDIYVGAAFYGVDDYYITKEAGTSNAVANVDPLHVLELGLNHAWIHENTEEISVDMHLDTRILAFGEAAGKSLTFRMEIREVGDSGFVLKGSKEYNQAELEALVETYQHGDPVVDEKGRTYYYLKNVTIPVDPDEDFTYTEDGEFEVYCTAMFTLDGWTNAIGAPYYRWGYSGGDRAYILKNETPIPASMVYFYNLDPETYHGALAAEAVAQVEEEMGIDIDVRYFTAENMTERIGYLAEWPGYTSYGELGVDRQPSEKTYKKKIILYCSLPSMVRDKLGDYIRETGVTNLLSSKLTAYGAAKSFEEFYKTQETEASVFTSALSLSLLAYETSTVVTEEKYGAHELWTEFKTAYDECLVIINTTKEQEESVYTNARLKLLDVYLRIIGKVQLTTEFKFLINEYDENNYKITVDQSNFPEDLEVAYRWYDASKEDYLIIPKDQLYKVKCSVSAVDDGPYYGFKSISLSVPAEPEYTVSSTANSISVSFAKYTSQVNTPEPITYNAELYQGSTWKASLSNETAESLTFHGLDAGTEYTLKLYATNLVGRTTYLTQTVNTAAAASSPSVSGGGSSDTSDRETVKNPDGSTTTTTKDPKTGTVTETIKTADGVTGTVVTDKNGAVTELSAKVPASAVTEGQTVTLPVELPAAASLADAAALRVQLPKSTGSILVEVPVTQVTPGTVAVLVHADGTEEIVKLSIPTDKGLALPLSGDATLKIVDNSKHFGDAQNHWAKDYIDFATSRELFSGTGGDSFTPDAPMTRAMLWTVMARFDGAAVEGGQEWYSNSMDWAKHNGISDGTDPNGNISREQLATMLWNYAGKEAVNTELAHYPDNGSVSGYAAQAMAWAVEQGLISGMDDGSLNPKGEATRAQLATILMHFCEYLAN